MNKKIIFVHGYTSSSKRDWYPNISKELNKLGLDYSIPDLPGGISPHSAEWLKVINEEAGKTSKPIILIGHSLGTRAVLLYLDKFEKKADTVLLIAPFNNNCALNRIGPYPDFFEYPVDIEKIKKLAKKFIVLHSTDDEAIDYQQGVDISKELGATLVTYNNWGHFHDPDSYNIILESLKSVL
ncbi:MAG: alpha/beta fold hydrolase [Candidatus Harrisonbacteria bacterium]|nr:alpha/beta fold hydrolase [Candidatus Harrisonbacteria bacterium]